MTTDTQLVAAARAGDRQAFGRIVERYQGAVSAVAYARTGDLALSQDVAQETFLAAWRGFAGLADPAKLKPWLCGISRNLALNAGRSTARERLAPEEPSAEIAAAEPSPLDVAIGREQQELLWRALGEIPETYREPLVLFYREGRSLEGVAEALDLGRDAVKQRLHRGREMLKAQVAAFVETALERTRPGKAFTIGVLAALPAAMPQVAAAGVAATAGEGAAAKTATASAGMAGAVFGPLLGMLGAYVGARFSIENTRSPRERAFMVRSVWVYLGYAAAFMVAEAVGLVFFRPIVASLGAQLLLCGGYAAGLVTLIVRGNQRQREIQIEDGTYVDPEAIRLDLSQATRAQIWGSLGGGIYGGTCWALPLAWMAGDWTTFVLVLAIATVILVVAARSAERSPRSYYRVSMGVVAALGVFNTVLLVRHWEQYMFFYRRSSLYSAASDLPLEWMLLLMLALVAFLLWEFHTLDRRSR